MSICRIAPGLIDEKLCSKYNLIYQEVTIVMTDVQGSTELWDWYERSCTSKPSSCAFLLLA